MFVFILDHVATSNVPGSIMTGWPRGCFFFDMHCVA